MLIGEQTIQKIKKEYNLKGCLVLKQRKILENLFKCRIEIADNKNSDTT